MLATSHRTFRSGFVNAVRWKPDPEPEPEAGTDSSKYQINRRVLVLSLASAHVLVHLLQLDRLGLQVAFLL